MGMGYYPLNYPPHYPPHYLRLHCTLYYLNEIKLPTTSIPVQCTLWPRPL